MHLSEVTWTDFRDFEADVGLLPVGSTEQHGPHAPLGTDNITATAVAQTAADESPIDVIIGPTIPIGIAEEHRQFPGSLWVSPNTFRDYLQETLEGLAFHGLERIVVVNGHGGNSNAIREVCARLFRDDVAYVVPFTWFESISLESHEMGHGGPMETSLVWHIREELIREDRLETAQTSASDRWGEWINNVNLTYDSIEFTQNGVVGDPSKADRETGRELLTMAAQSLVEVIDAVKIRNGTANSDP